MFDEIFNAKTDTVGEKNIGLRTWKANTKKLYDESGVSYGAWSPWFIAVGGFPFVLNDRAEKSMDLVFAFSCVAITRCIALGSCQRLVEQQVGNGLRHIVL